MPEHFSLAAAAGPPIDARREGAASTPFHRRYLTIVEELERTFAVAQWRSGDVPIWPLARMDLYDDMYCANAGGYAPQARPRPLPVRAIANAVSPLTNLWKSRRDLAHWVGRPRPGHAIFLGDGVSLDQLGESWRDRFSEPLIAAFEGRGLKTFLMQGGDLRHLPWHRPTFAANVVGAWASLAAVAAALPVELPQYEAVCRFLTRNGISSPSLTPANLARRARVVSAGASLFERVLRIVKPAVAFVVTYYAGLGAPFLLACRRQGILSVDMQHCPQDGGHKAYGWSRAPADGYAILPAVFWTWTQQDAADIRRWTDALPLPWHRSLHGGNTQIAPFLDDEDPATRAWDQKFGAIGAGVAYEREILIALQSIGGHRGTWDTLAAQIQAAPARWRWWIRRHPASRSYHDAQYGALLSLDLPNVNVQQASSLPLPALLRHMSVLISLASGASAEAEALGVPALFLSDDARGAFGNLMLRGSASIVDVRAINDAIKGLAAVPGRTERAREPGVDATIGRLETMAAEYSQLCRARRIAAS